MNLEDCKMMLDLSDGYNEQISDVCTARGTCWIWWRRTASQVAMQSTTGTGQKLKAQYICVRWGECGALEPLPEHPDLIVAQNAIARGARIIGLQARCGVGLNESRGSAQRYMAPIVCRRFSASRVSPSSATVSQSSRTSRRLSSAAGISSFDASARFRRLSISLPVFRPPRSSRLA